MLSRSIVMLRAMSSKTMYHKLYGKGRLQHHSLKPIDVMKMPKRYNNFQRYLKITTATQPFQKWNSPMHRDGKRYYSEKNQQSSDKDQQSRDSNRSGTWDEDNETDTGPRYNMRERTTTSRPENLFGAFTGELYAQGKELISLINRRKIISAAILYILYVFYKDYKKGFDLINIYPESLESELEALGESLLLEDSKIDDANVELPEGMSIYEAPSLKQIRFSAEVFRQKVTLAFNTMIAYMATINLFYGPMRIQTSDDILNARDGFQYTSDALVEEQYSSEAMKKMYTSGTLPLEKYTTLLAPSPFSAHLTLVIDVDVLFGILQDESYGHVLKKRPFSDMLFHDLSDNVEIILMSTYHNKIVARDLFHLFDPFNLATHHLTKEDMTVKGRNHIKPLEERLLGRKPSRLVVLDKNYDTCGNMCENVLRVKPWAGKPTDTTLLDILPLLKFMATSAEAGVDMRKIVKRYEGERSAPLLIRDQVLYSEPFPDENRDLELAHFDDD